MAHTIFKKLTYKGNTIEQVESFFQRFFVVNGDLTKAVWSISDVKKAINGATDICTVLLKEEILI